MKNLWEGLRQDDSEAMVLLYEQSYADLLSYGVQLSNNIETTKDAINDIFLNLWDNRSKLNPVENVNAYLFACIRRKIFQLTTINKKDSTLADDMQLYNPEPDLTHEDILIAIQRSDEIRRKVQKALEKLTERQRELIQMKYFKGMEYRQIELETGISIKTAYNTVYNAMKILADELRDILFIIAVFYFCD